MHTLNQQVKMVVIHSTYMQQTAVHQHMMNSFYMIFEGELFPFGQSQFLKHLVLGQIPKNIQTSNTKIDTN